MLFSGKLSIDARLQVAILFILASFFLVFLGLDRLASEYLLGFGLAGAAAAGAFYTLGATTPFAMVVILEQMQSGNAYAVAFAACLAASLVDTALFMAVRGALERNAAKLIAMLRTRFSRFSGAFPVAGFFVFGLPLPDELGIALMEMGSIDPVKVAIVVFSAKFATLLLMFSAFAR